MNISKEILDTHEVKLTVEVETENFLNAKRRAARQLSKKYKIPGFRPGKAPFAVVQKHLGEGAITEQAIGNLIDEIYPKAIEEAEIQPYGPGSLEEMPNLDPPTFEFRIPLAPEVELADYKGIRIEFIPKEVSEEDIQGVVNNLRESQATIEAVERPIEEGDMVYITLSGNKKGEQDPKEKVLLEERRYPVIIEKEDSDQENEYPFPGFSRKLIGLDTGDNKKIQHKFKEDDEFEELRGVTGIYSVNVEEIKGRALPEVNDDFAKSVGNYDTVNDLMVDIEQTLTEQFESDQISEYETKILDLLIENSKIEYPPQMLEDEIDDFIHDLEHQLAQQGLNIDLYLKSRSLEIGELRDEVKNNAEERMKRGLILMEVAKAEDITIPPGDINDRVQKTIEEVSAYYSEEEANRLGSGENLANLRNRIATDEIIKRTLKTLRDIAMGNLDEEEKEAKKDVESEVGTSSEKNDSVENLHDEENKDSSIDESAESISVGKETVYSEEKDIRED